MSKKTEYRNPLMDTPVESVTILHFHKGKNGRTYLVDPTKPTKNCRNGRCALVSICQVEVLQDYALAEGQVFALTNKGKVQDVSGRHKELQDIAKRHGLQWGENETAL